MSGYLLMKGVLSLINTKRLISVKTQYQKVENKLTLHGEIKK
jgi:hypothetical protein